VDEKTAGGGEGKASGEDEESAYVRYPRVSWFEGRTRRLIDCETRNGSQVTGTGRSYDPMNRNRFSLMSSRPYFVVKDKCHEAMRGVNLITLKYHGSNRAARSFTVLSFLILSRSYQRHMRKAYNR